MKKELIKRCFAGAPIGFTICVGITIVISLIVGDGTYYPVVPELIKICGSEVNAVLVQAIVGLLYGAMFGGTSLIWEMEKWSLLRQTITHLLIVSITTIPIAYFMHWMNHSILGVLAYMGTFFAIYAIIWISIYLSIRNKLNKINAKVKSV
ncbi:MAG: DUF3021 domain-containing protein [Lachnospiraceae bacterium]|nr:DUF3021 domain-containing protein [Lachnospiraceae bacterium]